VILALLVPHHPAHGHIVQTLRQGESGTYRIAAFPTAARSYVADTWREVRDGDHLGPALRLTELEPDAAIRFVDALPQGRLVTIPNCGHNVHSGNTPGFLAAVGEFLAGLDAPPA